MTKKKLRKYHIVDGPLAGRCHEQDMDSTPIRYLCCNGVGPKRHVVHKYDEISKCYRFIGYQEADATGVFATFTLDQLKPE